VIFCRVLLLLNAVTANSFVVPAKAGTHNHNQFYVIGTLATSAVQN
jgi:hypothetical protein